MKLSKSKLALAKVINENGGWPSDEANFAAQDKIDGESNDNTISFYSGKVKPTRLANNSMWRCENSGSHFMGYEKTISGCELIANWHQTCLSREEYYHAYPKADADEWIEWKGGMKSPVESGVPVDAKTKDGNEYYDQLLGDECWHNNRGDANIIAYRPHKPEVKPEFCESVTRSIPEPESIDGLCAKVTEENKHQHVDAKPTIEQLAADYRNAKGYADFKQQEADAAKADADEKLRVLEIAGEAHGLLVTPITAKQEPEMVIAVQVGDKVRCIKSIVNPGKYMGRIGTASSVDVDDTLTPYLVEFGGEAKIWCHEVKFILRP